MGAGQELQFKFNFKFAQGKQQFRIPNCEFKFKLGVSVPADRVPPLSRNLNSKFKIRNSKLLLICLEFEIEFEIELQFPSTPARSCSSSLAFVPVVAHAGRDLERHAQLESRFHQMLDHHARFGNFGLR